MYCKNCGNSMDSMAAVCVACGCAKGEGKSYCANCGQPIMDGAAVCLSCGYSTLPETASLPKTAENAKSKLAAGLLALFIGNLGIHNFYLGYTGKGIAQILLSWTGISGIWAFIEMILIFTGKIKDADGNELM